MTRLGNWKGLRKRLGGALALAALGLLAAGCADRAEPVTGLPSPGVVLMAAAAGQVGSDAGPALGSPYGAYLAGLFADRRHDLSVAADFMLQALEYDPDNAQLLSRTFILMAGTGRHAKAVELARRLNALNPEHGLVGLVLAVDAMERGRLEEADSYLSRLPERGLSTIAGPLMRGWIQIARGDAALALERAQPLKNKKGFDVLYTLHVALMNDVAGRVAAARTAYEEALNLSGQPTLRLVWVAGNFFERAGLPDKAAEIYRGFLEQNPESPLFGLALDRVAGGDGPRATVADAREGMAEVLFNLASLLSQERAEEVALIHAHLALRLKTGFEIARVLLGEILQAQGRGREAIAVYREVPADSPYSWMVRLRIAEALEKLEMTEEAIAELEGLASARPEYFEPLFRLGNLLRNRERYEEAVSAYDRAAARLGSPERRHWTLYYFRGIALERLSRWPRAEEDLLRALELEPEQPLVMNYLAYSWVEKKLNLDKAKRMLARAVELRPRDGYIIDSLGWVYYRLGEYDRGVKFLEQAVELRPQDPVINDHLGDAYWRVGRRQEARFQWRRALSLGPEEDLMPKIEAKIEAGLTAPPENI
ncbi:MAG: tetratricopeptide repeat protein [Kiloniellaceae bacterium]